MSKKAKHSEQPVEEAVESTVVTEAEIKAIDAVVETVKAVEYMVADGIAITSRKGVLGPGVEVKAEFFKGGEVVLNDLINKGSVVKR
jgi:hypothetical protein